MVSLDCQKGGLSGFTKPESISFLSLGGTASMMGNTSEDHDSFESSLVLWEDGSVTARYGYDSAVRRLHEYEVSGIPPDRERAGR